MTIGTLTVAPLVFQGTTYPGLVIALDILNFPDGFPHADPVFEVEPVKGMGVNYNRLRLNRMEYPADMLRCMAGYADYPTAVTAARAWRQLVGHTAQLSYTAGGIRYDLSDTNLYLTSVVASPIAGPLVGATLNVPGSQARVAAQFGFEYTAI